MRREIGRLRIWARRSSRKFLVAGVSLGEIAAGVKYHRHGRSRYYKAWTFAPGNQRTLMYRSGHRYDNGGSNER